MSMMRLAGLRFIHLGVLVALSGCAPGFVGFTFETPGVDSAWITRVNGKSTWIPIPGYVVLPIGHWREEVKGGESRRAEGISMQLETRAGIVAMAKVETWNQQKVVEKNEIRSVQKLGGPGSWEADRFTLTWSQSEHSSSRFLYVAPGQFRLERSNQARVIEVSPSRKAAAGEFYGHLCQLESNELTFFVDGFRIHCVLPIGHLLRVDHLRARQPIVELRGALSKCHVSGNLGATEIELERTESTKYFWTRYRLVVGAELRVGIGKRTSQILVTCASQEEPKSAIRIRLIDLNQGN